MANRNNVPSPVLSLPPLEYDIQYMNNLVRLLNYFIEQQDNPGNMRGTDLTLAKSTTLPATGALASNIIAKQGYTITSVGTTDFTLFGASSNTIGIHFVAIKNGDGSSGTGTVLLNTESAGVLTPIMATLIEDGQSCTITSIGTTDFTLIGATSNTVGIRFIASGAGTGTGTVLATTASGTVWCDPSDDYTLKILP